VRSASPPLTQPAVAIRGLTHRYGSQVVIDGLDLDVGSGEFVCLVGASGCGKTTLLHLIAELETPSAGVIGRSAGRTAVMFQENGLFPWLTASRNVELALEFSGVTSRRQRRTRARELLEVVRLGNALHKRPHELSGGMRQRVALARALAQEAELLLMDEPFGALDAMTRDLLHDELERVCAERELSVLFVTHNVREAARLGDRIVLLGSRPGRVIETFDVSIPRPRRIDSTEIATLAAHITDQLRQEVIRHGR